MYVLCSSSCLVPYNYHLTTCLKCYQVHRVKLTVVASSSCATEEIFSISETNSIIMPLSAKSVKSWSADMPSWRLKLLKLSGTDSVTDATPIWFKRGSMFFLLSCGQLYPVFHSLVEPVFHYCLEPQLRQMLLV